MNITRFDTIHLPDKTVALMGLRPDHPITWDREHEKWTCNIKCLRCYKKIYPIEQSAHASRCGTGYIVYVMGPHNQSMFKMGEIKKVKNFFRRFQINTY